MAGTRKAIVINDRDNVATALEPLKAGSVVLMPFHNRVEKIRLESDIPPGHKFALYELERGAAVIKYGEIIGRTLFRVSRGEHVHVHNVTSPLYEPRGA